MVWEIDVSVLGLAGITTSFSGSGNDIAGISAKTTKSGEQPGLGKSDNEEEPQLRAIVGLLKENGDEIFATTGFSSNIIRESSGTVVVPSVVRDPEGKEAIHRNIFKDLMGLQRFIAMWGQKQQDEISGLSPSVAFDAEGGTSRAIKLIVALADCSENAQKMKAYPIGSCTVEIETNGDNKHQLEVPIKYVGGNSDLDPFEVPNSNYKAQPKSKKRISRIISKLKRTGSQVEKPNSRDLEDSKSSKFGIGSSCLLDELRKVTLEQAVIRLQICVKTKDPNVEVTLEGKAHDISPGQGDLAETFLLSHHRTAPLSPERSQTRANCSMYDLGYLTHATARTAYYGVIPCNHEEGDDGTTLFTDYPSVATGINALSCETPLNNGTDPVASVKDGDLQACEQKREIPDPNFLVAPPEVYRTSTTETSGVPKPPSNGQKSQRRSLFSRNSFKKVFSASAKSNKSDPLKDINMKKTRSNDSHATCKAGEETADSTEDLANSISRDNVHPTIDEESIEMSTETNSIGESVKQSPPRSVCTTESSRSRESEKSKSRNREVDLKSLVLSSSEESAASDTEEFSDHDLKRPCEEPKRATVTNGAGSNPYLCLPSYQEIEMMTNKRAGPPVMAAPSFQSKGTHEWANFSFEEEDGHEEDGDEEDGHEEDGDEEDGEEDGDEEDGEEDGDEDDGEEDGDEDDGEEDGDEEDGDEEGDDDSLDGSTLTAKDPYLHPDTNSPSRGGGYSDEITHVPNPADVLYNGGPEYIRQEMEKLGEAVMQDCSPSYLRIKPLQQGDDRNQIPFFEDHVDGWWNDPNLAKKIPESNGDESDINVASHDPESERDDLSTLSFLPKRKPSSRTHKNKYKHRPTTV